MERYNGIIWLAISTCLKSRNLPVNNWQDVLPDVLHSVRSLLCTASNKTPHERFFSFPRRSSVGSSVPSWLLKRGPVLIKRQVRSNKTDALVDEVELLQANPHFVFVRFPDGRETTVSTKQLAPPGQEQVGQQSLETNEAVNPAPIPGVALEYPTTTAVELRSFEISNERKLDTNFPLESPATESTRMDQSPENLPPLRRQSVYVVL